jgi:GR25 family glycosyltransferase involved in LPS biosynthesis
MVSAVLCVFDKVCSIPFGYSHIIIYTNRECYDYVNIATNNTDATCTIITTDTPDRILWFSDEVSINYKNYITQEELISYNIPYYLHCASKISDSVIDPLSLLGGNTDECEQLCDTYYTALQSRFNNNNYDPFIYKNFTTVKSSLLGFKTPTEYYVVFRPSGRLGNAIFRYLCCALLCEKYNMKYILYNDFLSDNNIHEKDNILSDVTEQRFIELMNDNNKINSHILVSGIMQIDFIYTHYKSKIMKWIGENPHHQIQTDGNDNYSRYNVSDIVLRKDTKAYDVCIHLRLGDVFRSKNHDNWHYVSPEYLFPVYEELYITKKFENKNVCIVVESKTPDEMVEIKKHTDWFSTKGINVTIENNDILTDYHIVKNSKIVICTHSSFSWMAVYFSQTVTECYCPNYNYFQNHMTNVCFRNPIVNTRLYNTWSTSIRRVRAMIITLENIPERTEKCLKLINNLNRIGITTELFYGADGRDITTTSINDDIYVANYKDNYYICDNRYKKMKRGELGCAISHVSVYKKLLTDNYHDYYLIFEDDADLVCSLDHLYKSIINLQSSSYNLVHMAMSDWYPFSDGEKSKIDGFLIPQLQHFNRATAYMISKGGCIKLLNAIDYNRIGCPADDLLSLSYNNGIIDMIVPTSYFFKERIDNFSSILQVNDE